MALTTARTPVHAARTIRALDPAEIDWAALRRVYPENDGQPMAENTRQYEWITTIVGGLQALFRDAPDVFVAGDLLWYPEEGQPARCVAPDALVVFGRPKGHRGSYLQFLEGGIAPQVVFEVLSPKNTAREMADKRAFYEQYGVEEYYEYDPDRGALRGWRRHSGRLSPVAEMRGWLSPRLGVRFDLEDGELRLYRPGGQPFASYVELEVQREQAHRRAEEEHRRAEEEHRRAEDEHRRAEEEHRRAEDEHRRAERLAVQLRTLGIDPEVP